MKVRDGHTVRTGGLPRGRGGLRRLKHVLGIWVQTSEGAKFWAGCWLSFAPRRGRCADRLRGWADRLPGGDRGHLAATVAQTCVVHLIRASMRTPPRDRRRSRRLAPIYTAPTAAVAVQELDIFADSNWGRSTRPRYGSGGTRGSGLSRCVPPRCADPLHHKFDRVVDYQLRKIIKNRGHSPMTIRWSSCCGWRSVTSRTNGPENVLGRPAGPEGSLVGSSETRGRRPGPRLESRLRRSQLLPGVRLIEMSQRS